MDIEYSPARWGFQTRGEGKDLFGRKKPVKQVLFLSHSAPENRLYHREPARQQRGGADLTQQAGAGTAGKRLEQPGVNRSGERAGLGVLFLALLALCGLFPLTGDDWFREELGRHLAGPADLLEAVAAGWRTYNGRILGNLLAYAAGSRRLLRELLRAAFLFGTVRLTAGHGGFRTVWGTLLAAAALLALPQAMFAQIYPWAAGFFNYVPPAALMLAALWLLRNLFAERPVPGGVPRAAAVFLLGFCGQLFVEHITLCGVWAGIVLLMWSWQRRLPPVPAAAFCGGTLLGALALFLSPSYGLIWGGGAYSAGLGRGIAGLWAAVQENLPAVLLYLISGCPALYVPLTVLGLVWFAAARRTGLDRLLAALLALGCGWFALSGQTEAGGIWGETLAAVLWGTALWAGCRRWLPRGERRNRFLFFLASAVVGALPLLAVSPIGPRCLYWSYVCLTISAGNLLSALPLGLLPRRPVRGAVLGLAAGVLAFYLALFLPIHLLEGERRTALEEAVEQGQRAVVLPAYPNGDYLWEGDTPKIGSRFYIQHPGDLSIFFVPAEEWAERREEVSE